MTEVDKLTDGSYLVAYTTYLASEMSKDRRCRGPEFAEVKGRLNFSGKKAATSTTCSVHYQ